MWRFGFNSRRLKSIGSISSSAYVRRSRGESDQIRRWFVINLAPIVSQSSLNGGGSRRTQDLAKKLLKSFTIQSRVKIQSENIDIDKRNLQENRRPFNLMKLGWMSTIGRMRWAMILWRGATFLLLFRLSNFDQTVVIPPRVAPRLPKSRLISRVWCFTYAINSSI